MDLVSVVTGERGCFEVGNFVGLGRCEVRVCSRSIGFVEPGWEFQARVCSRSIGFVEPGWEFQEYCEKIEIQGFVEYFVKTEDFGAKGFAGG